MSENCAFCCKKSSALDGQGKTDGQGIDALRVVTIDYSVVRPASRQINEGEILRGRSHKTS